MKDLAVRETEPLGGLPVQRRGACVGSGEVGSLWKKYTVERLLRTPPTPIIHLELYWLPGGGGAWLGHADSVNLAEYSIHYSRGGDLLGDSLMERYIVDGGGWVHGMESRPKRIGIGTVGGSSARCGPPPPM